MIPIPTPKLRKLALRRSLHRLVCGENDVMAKDRQNSSNGYKEERALKFMENDTNMTEKNR